MNRAIIICGGDFAPELLPLREEGDRIIAADSGYRKAKAAGIVPDIAIGDWDSLGKRPEDCETVTLPRRKDDTDLVAACRLAMERGCREIVLLGALGGSRFSHSLAAVQALGWLADQGIRAQIRDGGSCLFALKEGADLRFAAREKGSLSVFSITDEAVFSAEGLWYSGSDITLTSRFPLGVSNAFIGEPAEIRCKKGILVLVTERTH